MEDNTVIPYSNFLLDVAWEANDRDGNRAGSALKHKSLACLVRAELMAH